MRKVLITLVLLLALGLVACSGKYKPDNSSEPGATVDTGPTGQTGTAADCVDQTGGEATITISGYAYDPTCLRVSASGSLTIVNEDPSAHSFSVAGGLIDETLDIGDRVKIKSLSELAPGTYAFNCRFHPPMVGTLIVE